MPPNHGVSTYTDNYVQCRLYLETRAAISLSHYPWLINDALRPFLCYNFEEGGPRGHVPPPPPPPDILMRGHRGGAPCCEKCTYRPQYILPC